MPASESLLAEYHRRIGDIFLAPGQTPYRICKQVWQLHAEMGRLLAVTPDSNSCPGQGLGWCDCPPDPEEAEEASE